MSTEVTTAGVRGGGLPTLLTAGAPHTETWAEGHVRRGRAGWERVTYCRYCPKAKQLHVQKYLASRGRAFEIQ